MGPVRTVTGSCLPGCAKCCKLLIVPHDSKGSVVIRQEQVIIPLPWRALPKGDQAEFWRVRGVKMVIGPDGPQFVIDYEHYGKLWLGWYNGERAVFVESTCPMLRGTECSIHSHKPRVCQDFPTERDSLEMLPGCGFKVGESRV